MEKEKSAYRSFLLRMWQVKQNGDWIWRCSLEETGSDQQRKFVDLDALFGYLSVETGAPQFVHKENKR
jgi:hypothetical protein